MLFVIRSIKIILIPENYILKVISFKARDTVFSLNDFLYSSENTIEQYFEEYLEDKVWFVKELKGEFLLSDYNEEDSLFFATVPLEKENAFIY